MTPEDAKHERALTHELLRTYRQLNTSLFTDALRPPALSLVDGTSFWARWLPGTRQIEVSRRLAREKPWTQVVEVLKHEMAHQFVHEVLGETESPHGPAFRSVCERLGIDARSAGLPADAEARAPETARVLSRVQKLLALAQSDNQHEAESAAASAQRLMLKYNIEESQTVQSEDFGFRQLGRVTGRTQEWERRLGNLLSEHFFVEVIWVPAYRPEDQKRGYVLEAIGSDANLEMAEYVHSFVTTAAESLWRGHKREAGIRSDATRRAFLSGVIAGFAEKLRSQAQKHEAQGLVWLPGAAQAEHVRKRHPYVRSVRHRASLSREAFGQGRAAGRGLVLHRGVSHGTSNARRRLRG